MALSFQDWYKAYANQAGAGSVADPVLQQLNLNVTNPAFETDFQRLLARIGTIGTSANASREGLANDTRRAANQQGLSDETQVLEDSRKAGNASLGTADAITYKVKLGPDGRAYRQAYLNTSASFGARGWGGSQEKAAQWKARQDLNTARDNLTDDLSTGQNKSLITQGTDEGNAMGDLSKAVTDYGTWKVNNMPQSPNMGSGTNTGGGGGEQPSQPAAPAAPDRFRGIQVGGVLGTYGSSPNERTLRNAYGAGNYRINRAGNGRFVVVRTR